MRTPVCFLCAYRLNVLVSAVFVQKIRFNLLYSKPVIEQLANYNAR